jgi:hypothetical protein
MTQSIGHHFPCPECGFDLYSAPVNGRCPECGRPIPKRKGLEKQKNPRRVNSQHRARIRRAYRNLWIAAPITLLSLIIAAGAFYFLVAKWLALLAWIVLFIGSIWLLNIWLVIARAQSRIVPEEESL